jgi:RNA polymerase sigma factor (TIGR02999 family)
LTAVRKCATLSRRAHQLRTWAVSTGDLSAISSLIDKAERGDPRAADDLFAALYSELRRLSRHELARYGGPLTLSPTTLLHQAYLDIAERGGASFPDRARFMAYAARVMRGLIIDYARHRRALKRGGSFEITSLADSVAEHLVDAERLTELSDALDDLTTIDRQLAEVVDLRFFCGFTFAEIAAMRQTSERTVQRQWEKARIYLRSRTGAQEGLKARSIHATTESPGVPEPRNAGRRAARRMPARRSSK